MVGFALIESAEKRTMSNDSDLKIVDGGGVASAKGFQAGGVFAGIKTPGEDKYDLGLLYSERDCAVAGTFTRNSIMSPSVTVSKRVVERGESACRHRQQRLR